MDCADARKLIDRYTDRELDATAGDAVEAHLETCAKCAAVHRGNLALRDGARDLRVAPPSDFAARIRTEIREDARQRHALSLRTWRIVALAACVIAAVSIAFALLKQNSSAPHTTLADAVVTSHVRSLMADHLFDVESSNEHNVKPWFTGKIDFAPDVRKFDDAGFPLAGGRLDYLDGRAVAALVYRHEKHVINAFTWPARPGERAVTSIETRDGFHIIRFRVDEMEWCLISDASMATLQTLARLIEQPSPQQHAPATSPS